MKRELLKKTKLSLFEKLFVPIPTYGHKPWVLTKKVQSQMKAYEMRFYEELKDLHYITMCVALKFETL